MKITKTRAKDLAESLTDDLMNSLFDSLPDYVSFDNQTPKKLEKEMEESEDRVLKEAISILQTRITKK